MLISSTELATFGPFRLVIIQPTPFCNINCDYCYLPDRQSRQILDLDLIEPIFTNLLQSRFLGQHFTVCWHAGEPLALPVAFYGQALEKINQIQARYPDVDCLITHALQTNGTLITPAWCELFQKYQISVGVSIDGPAFLHDAHRQTRTGLGTHAATLRGIQHLQAWNINFHTITVLTQETLHHPQALFDFFWEAGIHNIGFNVEEIEGAHAQSSLQGDTEELYLEFMETFWHLTKQTQGKLKVREFDRISECLYTQKQLSRNQLCTPFAMVNIDVNGNFSTYSPELLGMTSDDYGRFILGHVQTDSFEAACFTPKFAQIYADIQAGVVACRDSCDYFDICGGGAPSNKYWEHGTFQATETLHCRYTQKLLLDLILADVEKSLGQATVKFP
ncbi:cyclophane-forming radical SAM/SPASM peptide maturase GrrM/OscB [Synechococcus sp. PCC 6312]|uniref:cyclophane-forming radical SAM/SPASM peptide maturase GrrM/OscB n=1 Tax=Synechococcus sp. (strain ATCC 27167 / PCC 6312) TaxID=195253 RepID=UPI00029F2F97|nr:cyclophane-forming radical SAM/SPASM peptide maturase GrrM/OscB [Synechococcus sp. PCC 6312]AFY61523.1 arylsulfatase regulator (Fe-S oxidoreductase) [Synechococcus sp. PCC 6312]